MTRLPSFSSRPPLPDELSLTCRVSECFVRLGGLAVRIITVYGHTPDSGQSQHLNAALFDKIKARVISSAVPAIVGGDFNQRPQTIPACQDLLDRGYREAHAFHKLKTGLDLPSTCRGSTSNDTLLIHPDLAPLWHSATVQSGQLEFDSAHLSAVWCAWRAASKGRAPTFWTRASTVWDAVWSGTPLSSMSAAMQALAS